MPHGSANPEERPFGRTPPKAPVALIDLIETGSSGEAAGIREGLARTTRACGGRVVLENRAIAPMIVPDGVDDDPIRWLVVSRFPTVDAGRRALDQRTTVVRGPDADRVRCFAARPARRVEAWIGRHLPTTLGRLRREAIPSPSAPDARDALIERGLILGEQPDASRWRRLVEASRGAPIWMLNFLGYREVAAYAQHSSGDAPASPVSGAEAYGRYGRGMIGCLAAVGGWVVWAGPVVRQLGGPAERRWDQVAIARYPSAAAMLSMLAMPKYRAAHVHRAAALEDTRLLATEPA